MEARSYDEAVRLLVDLREVAVREDPDLERTATDSGATPDDSG